MKDFARLGAEARISELNQELEAIYGAFPELRQGRWGRGARKVVVNQEEPSPFVRAGRGGAGAAQGNGEARPAKAARKRKPMSAAQKKAVGERMRKYWQARRAAQGAKKR